jgi:hypothetical protein
MFEPELLYSYFTAVTTKNFLAIDCYSTQMRMINKKAFEKLAEIVEKRVEEADGATLTNHDLLLLVEPVNAVSVIKLIPRRQ